MRALRVAALLASLALLPAGALSAPDNKSGAVPPLGPGDVIQITVDNHPDLNMKVPIPPDGVLQIPEAGDVKATGKTPTELRADLQAAVDKVRNNARVSVMVVETHSRKVTVVGDAVKTPVPGGEIDLRPDWRLLDVLGPAGALAVKTDRLNVRVVRGGKAIKVDMAQVLDKPETDANLKLEPGDLILAEELPVIHTIVNVWGEVNKPGPVEVDPKTMTLVDVLTAAGPKESASLSKARLSRGKEVFNLNLTPLFGQGTLDPALQQFKLKDGDYIFIPQNTNRFGVVGSVARPQVFLYPEGKTITVSDAYVMAGGTTNGDPAKATIVRNVDGKQTLIKVNIDAITKKGDASQNMVLQPGDILAIPPRGHGVSPLELLSPFYYLRLLIP